MTKQKLISFALCGSYTRDYDPYEATSSLDAQRILLVINLKPLSLEEIAIRAGMREQDVLEYLRSLMRCGLIEELTVKGEVKYRPSFAIFTLRDQKRLMPLISELTNSLVHICRDFMPKVRNELKQIECIRAGYSFSDLEYIVIGAYASDFNALGILKEEGLLLISKEMPGGRYVFAGLERGLMDLREALMWGHISEYGRYAFCTHGELPPRGPRRAFPDIARSWAIAVERTELIERKMIEYGDILCELLHGPVKFKELIERLEFKLGKGKLELASDLALLEGLGYLTPPEAIEGRLTYKLGRPMLTPNDLELIQDISRRIIGRFSEEVKRRYSSIKAIYSRTAPAKNDVSIEEAFNQIYHLIFARALRALINTGTLASPPPMRDGGRYSAWVAMKSSD